MDYNGFSVARIAEVMRSAEMGMGIRPIVSVGSGNGWLESILLQECKIANIICVDPDPESFRPYQASFSTKPDYPNVQKLLMERKELATACDLLLGWPTPNDSTYDIEAIRSLQPQNIFVVHEPAGGAGGAEFQSWLRMQIDYKPVHSETHRTSSRGGFPPGPVQQSHTQI